MAFCSFCGTATGLTPIICRTCGTAMRRDAAFCQRCGAELGDPPEPATPDSTLNTPGWQPWLLLGGSALVSFGLCLTLAAIGFFFVTKPFDQKASVLAEQNTSGSSTTVVQKVNELSDGKALALSTPGGVIPASRQDWLEVSTPGMGLRHPQAWVMQDNKDAGIVLAQRQEDLTASVPKGPRLSIEPGAGGTFDIDIPTEGASLIKSEEEDSKITRVGEPELVTVSGIEGTAIELHKERAGSPMVTRYVFVSPGGGRAYLLTLEASSGEWNAGLVTMNSIIQTIQFSSTR